jgi:folate-binding protein YgfZ
MPTARLPERTVIAVTGGDATGFLQNIVTADMDDVDSDGIGYGALLTPQGKIICDFLIHEFDDGYHVDVRREANDTLLKRLTLYKLRASVDIESRPDLAVFATWDENSVSHGARPDPRLAALGRRRVAPSDEEAAADAGDWDRWRISLGVPEGGVDYPFDESFPHDAALDALTGVDFDKGCFVGQEVVSRMRHRGTARRRIVKVRGDGPLPAPGTEITAGERPLGRLGSSVEDQGIAVVRLDRLQKALGAGETAEAGGVRLEIALPDWANYAMPESTSDSGDED